MDRGVTHVYMGYETGTNFTHTDETLAEVTTELTTLGLFRSKDCNLVIRGPFFFIGYTGMQTSGNGDPYCNNLPGPIYRQ